MSTRRDTTEAELQRLREAEETLDAIRRGAVDAVVVEGERGQQIYTLESADQPFRIFVEQMQEGALTLAADGTIVYCNRFFADLLGRGGEQVMGARLQEFAADPTRVLGDFAARTLQGPYRDECRLRRADGSEVLVQMAFSRLPSAEPGLFGVVVTDLTAREQARQLELEHRASQEANAARDQFLAVVSHELRTPLNAIMGWTQLLARRQDLPEAVARGLEIIERSGWAQAKLIDDLLDVSRVLAGKLRLEREPVELGAIVTAAIGTMQPEADAHQITLIPELTATDAVVHGDPARLRQIVSNLLHNAIKYTPAGGEARVRLTPQGDEARIEIVDNGAGIRGSVLPKLFDLFEQADSGPSRRSGGLGLGLAIVKQLTELHGGRVWIHSAGEGAGTTATVALPLADTRPPARASARPGAAPPPLGGLRVLLVEDEAWALEMLAQALTAADAAVLTASTADAALAIIAEQPVDVLVSDLGLPGMDGYQLIERVRASGRTAQKLPAVALTAFASREDRRRVLLAGYQVHLPKPVDQEELCAVLASLADCRAPD